MTLPTPIYERRKGTYFACCHLCEKQLRDTVAIYDTVDDNWFCDEDCAHEHEDLLRQDLSNWSEDQK